jgi:hypothetical protein
MRNVDLNCRVEHGVSVHTNPSAKITKGAEDCAGTDLNNQLSIILPIYTSAVVKQVAVDESASDTMI